MKKNLIKWRGSFEKSCANNIVANIFFKKNGVFKQKALLIIETFKLLWIRF